MRHEPILAVVEPSVSQSEVLSAFSFALDLTEGQPQGHSLRACYIGSLLGREIGLPQAELDELFYSVLLKDLGCSSNAARIWELYAADDLEFKRAYKTIGTGLPATLGFVFDKTGVGKPLRRRVGAIANILRNGDTIAQEMIETRCTRGSDIARKIGLSEAVCSGIYHLDEHFDGSGRPAKIAGDSIPLFARIALLAQIADVFHSHAGPQAAIEEVVSRSGSWLDPELVKAFRSLVMHNGFWSGLAAHNIEANIARLAPKAEFRTLDEDYLDLVAEAFGVVIDAKSPYTSGHSLWVADFADGVAARMDVIPARRRELRRAAALHDIGKLGVSNAILDKPGKLGEEEWDVMRSHASLTQEILGRISVFSNMASLAAAHHERLDGTGYPLGLAERELARETRIITVCDFYDALTADRPYRAAMPREKALSIMEGEIGKAIDADCFEALRAIT